MSITYPETQPSRGMNSRAVPSTGGESALFPGGAANLYDRARSARSGRTGKGKGLPVAWIAAPVAVILVGGAIAISLPHGGAMKPVSAARTTTTTTSAAAAPMAAASKPAAVAPTKSVTHETVTSGTSRDAVAAARTAPVVTHRVSTSAARETDRQAQTESLPTAPGPYAQTESGQVRSGQTATQTATPVQAQPAPAAPAQAVTPAPVTTPTPGNFAFTAPATGPDGAQPVQAAPTQPSTDASPPTGAAATTSQSQPSPQG